MDKTPLVIDEINAGKTFIQQMNEYAPVKAATWLRSAEEGERYLYVALDRLKTENTDVAYREVLRVATGMKDQYIDPFRVKGISPSDPIAKDLMDVYRRFPGPVPTRYPGQTLGGVPVGDVYVYPPPPAKK